MWYVELINLTVWNKPCSAPIKYEQRKPAHKTNHRHDIFFKLIYHNFFKNSQLKKQELPTFSEFKLALTKFFGNIKQGLNNPKIPFPLKRNLISSIISIAKICDWEAFL